jgi:phosphoglucomutase
MNYLTKYQQWLDEMPLTTSEVETLKSMTDDEIKEAFTNDLSFGTGGIRGILGLGTNRVNRFTIIKITKGLANHLIQKYPTPIKVAVSFDNRHFSKSFSRLVGDVLASYGISSYIFEDLRPTPMLSFAVRHFKCQAGIMITASHNPKEYNGYKVYDQTGCQVTDLESSQLINEINQVTNYAYETNQEYINYIHESFDDLFYKKMEQIKILNEPKLIKVVYSPLHGTGGTVIPKFLCRSGYSVLVVKEQMTNDPDFIATKSSNPEDQSSFELGLIKAKEHDADAVLVTDPDADRLGIAVKHQKEYVLLNGNQTAAVILNYLLENKKHLSGYVCATIVTSGILKQITQNYQLRYLETLTGFKYIGEQIQLNQGKDHFIFGAEESYGCLLSDYVRDKDAVGATIILAEIINHLKNKNLTIVDYLEKIYQTVGYFVEDTLNITLAGLKGLTQIEKVMDYFRNNAHQVLTNKCDLVEDYLLNIEKYGITLPKSNVIKLYYDKSWIAVRPSGTEPKLKIYLSAQAKTKAAAEAIVNDYKQQLNALVKKIIGG